MAQNSPFNFNDFLGLERTGGAVSIAVDPSNSAVVYVSWADTQNKIYTVHLRKSSDRGLTWSANDLKTVPKMQLIPPLAVNNKGVVGLLYQQLVGTIASQRWITHFSGARMGRTGSI